MLLGGKNGVLRQRVLIDRRISGCIQKCQLRGVHTSYRRGCARSGLRDLPVLEYPLPLKANCHSQGHTAIHLPSLPRHRFADASSSSQPVASQAAVIGFQGKFCGARRYSVELLLSIDIDCHLTFIVTHELSVKSCCQIHRITLGTRLTVAYCQSVLKYLKTIFVCNALLIHDLSAFFCRCHK